MLVAGQNLCMFQPVRLFLNELNSGILVVDVASRLLRIRLAQLALSVVVWYFFEVAWL